MSNKTKGERLKAEYLKRPEHERRTLAKGFITVQKSGLTNMMDRAAVVKIAEALDETEFAEFAKERENYTLFISNYRDLVGQFDAGGNE